MGCNHSVPERTWYRGSDGRQYSKADGTLMPYGKSGPRHFNRVSVFKVFITYIGSSVQVNPNSGHFRKDRMAQTKPDIEQLISIRYSHNCWTTFPWSQLYLLLYERVIAMKYICIGSQTISGSGGQSQIMKILKLVKSCSRQQF